MKAALDKAMNKVASRKLWAWLVATGALVYGSLASGDWVVITAVYIGSQAAVDIIERLN